MGFAVLTPTYLEHAARMRFGGDRSDFFRDDYLPDKPCGKRGGDRVGNTRPVWVVMARRVSLLPLGRLTLSRVL